MKRKIFEGGTALLLAAMLCVSLPFSRAFAKEDYVIDRSESVYVDLASDGTPETMISSVYLTNTEKSETLEDSTTLHDIKNVLGNDKPKIDGERVVFTADGEDVCYQGSAEGELPVTVSINYTLDGKAIKAEELAGKSGKVGIHIRTFNRDRHLSEVEGAQVALYTPFSVICVLRLNDGFSMIQCQNGRIISEAGSTNVMTILQPGLKESLGIAKNDSIHDELRLWADVDSFSMDSMTFVVMTGLVEQQDLGAIDDVQKLIDGIDELADATDELYDGAFDMSDGITEYIDGIKSFSDGLQEYKEGLEKYAGGVTELFFGIKELNNGAGKLTTGAWQLNSGVKEMESSIQKAATDSSGAMKFASETAYGVNQFVFGGTLNTSQMENLTAVLNNAYKSASTTTLTQLLTGLSKLESGTSTYAVGVAEYKAGAGKLADGALEVVGATGELRDGVIDLQDGATALEDGAVEIRDGAEELTDGIGEFRDDGIKEMQEQVSDIRVSMSRKDALLALSDDYTSFSGTNASKSSSVQFIMTSKEIVPEKPIIESDAQLDQTIEQKEAEQNKEKLSWWEKLWTAIQSWFK